MLVLDRLFKHLIQSGRLTVTWPNGRQSHYRGPQPNGRHSAIRIRDWRTAFRLALRPELAAGEAYMSGGLVIETGDIRQMLDLILYNMRWERDNKIRGLLGGGRHWWTRLTEMNGRTRAQHNVAHHYDLSDRLYQLFLDDDRQYSCGYFLDPANDIDTAQDDKKAHIAAKLLLHRGQRVLDVGCGWGGLALYLNRVAKVDVLGITLSDEQLSVARARAESAGVSDHVRFEKRDYRDLQGRFDRIVSVGMFEHVGRPNYRRFFDAIADHLDPSGVALVHTIGRADGPGETDAWTRKYIFPGGYSPALSEIIPTVEQAGLWATDIEILRLHYAYTLERWYARTQAARAEIEKLYDARFFRMWSFYLASAIGAFRHGGHCNFQIQLAPKRDSVPITRGYVELAERQYRALNGRALAAAE